MLAVCEKKKRMANNPWKGAKDSPFTRSALLCQSSSCPRPIPFSLLFGRGLQEDDKDKEVPGTYSFSFLFFFVLGPILLFSLLFMGRNKEKRIKENDSVPVEAHAYFSLNSHLGPIQRNIWPRYENYKRKMR